MIFVFDREPKPITVSALRTRMKPYIDSAREYQREMSYQKRLTSKQLKVLSAANHLETLDSLAANGISPNSPAGVRAILASKVAFARAGKIPRLLSDPKLMQQSMQKTFLDDDFKKFVSSMDAKTIKAMMHDSGSKLNKKFNEYVKAANLKKQTKPVQSEKKTKSSMAL